MQKGNKIFTLLIVSVFIFVQSAQTLVFAAEGVNSYYMNSLIVSKNKLENTKGGKNYVRQINSLVTKYSKNKKVLEKLNTRSNTVLSKFKTPTTLSEKQVVAIMSYLKVKTNQALENIEEKEEEKIKEEKEKKVALILEQIEANQLSQSDHSKVNNKIVQVQTQVYDSLSSNLIKIKEELKEIYNVQQTWNLDISTQVNIKDIQKIDFKALFNDYEITANGFDSQVKTDIDIFFESIGKNPEDKHKIELAGHADIISKNGEIYMLLQDMLIKSEGGNFDDLKEVIQNIAEQNDYIKVPNREAEAIYRMLNNFSLNTFLDETKRISQKPLLKAYKKEGNTYSLVPTKFACQTAKENLYKIYSFIEKDCSEDQYKELLEEFVSAWEFTLEISGNTSTLRFMTQEATISLSFNKTEVVSFLANIHPDEEHKLSMDYKKKEKLNISFFESGWSGIEQLEFTSTLNRNNKFTSINSNYTFTPTSKWRGPVKSNLTLKNKKISGKYTKQNKKYDSATHMYSDSNIFQADITGKTNSQHDIDSFDIKLTDNEDMSWNITYSNNTLGIKIEEENENKSFMLDFSAKYNSYDKIITDGSFNIIAKSKKRRFDYDTYKTVYEWEMKEKFNLDLQINNKNVYWKMLIKDHTQELFSMNISWEYTKESCDFDFDFEFKNPLYREINKDAQSSTQKQQDKQLNGTLNIVVNAQNNNANSDINLDIYDSKNNVDIKFDLKNRSRVEYGDFDIILPEMYINFEEILEMGLNK